EPPPSLPWARSTLESPRPPRLPPGDCHPGRTTALSAVGRLHRARTRQSYAAQRPTVPASAPSRCAVRFVRRSRRWPLDPFLRRPVSGCALHTLPRSTASPRLLLSPPPAASHPD